MKNQDSKKVESNKINILDKLFAKNKNIQDNEVQKSSSNGEIYNYPKECISDKQRTTFRRNMRKNILPEYYSLICFSGLKNPNFEKDLNDFKRDYFNFWKIQDFKISSFSNSRKKETLEEHQELLDVLKDYIELSK